VLRDELFSDCSNLSIGEISKIEVRLLIFPESEIESGMMALVTRIRTRNGEASDKARCVSGGIQAKGSENNAVAAASALHQEVAIPLVGHGQCEGDAEFLAVNAAPAIQDSFDSAIRGKRGGTSFIPGNRLGSSSFDVSGLSDLEA
jgi:hypothetical protein